MAQPEEILNGLEFYISFLFIPINFPGLLIKRKSREDGHGSGPWRETTLKETSPGGKGLLQPCLSVKLYERVSIRSYRLPIFIRQLLDRLNTSFKRLFFLKRIFYGLFVGSKVQTEICNLHPFLFQ